MRKDTGETKNEKKSKYNCYNGTLYRHASALVIFVIIGYFNCNQWSFSENPSVK